MIANFYMEDKNNRPRFFQEIFLIADIKIEVILENFFLKIINVNILFSYGTLT